MPNKTELEVFGDVSCPMRMQYSLYKVYCNLKNEKPKCPEVWVCFQTLKMIERGILTDIDRKDAEEALNELGWAIHKNDKGEMVLWPYVA